MQSEVDLILAEGFEEIEAITVVDVLRRADIPTRSWALESLSPCGAHGIRLHADALLEGAEEPQGRMVVLPGGMPGSANLRDNARVQALLRRYAQEGKWLAAICAAPIALARAGLLDGKKVTSYPSVREQLEGASYLEQDVVVDAPLVTSRGPATALPFALRLVALLRSEEAAEDLARRMLWQA